MSCAKISRKYFSKFLFTVLVAAGGCGFQHGFHLGVTNISEDLFKVWLNETKTRRLNGTSPPENSIKTIWSIVTSVFAVGGLLGALLTGYFSERYGRKKSLFWNSFLIMGGVGFMLWSKRANSPELLITGRFIAGFYAGLNSGICPMYLVEIAPDKIRGLIAGLFPVFIDFGMIVSYIAGVAFGTRYQWSSMFLISLILACLQVILLLMCPESPKHLVIGKDNEDEAEKSLKWLKGEGNVSKYMKAIIEEDNLVKELHASTLKRLFRDIKLRTPLIICVIMSLGHQLCGINCVLFHSKRTFQTLLNSTEHDAIPNILTISIGAVMMTGDAISVSLVDRMGRRIFLLISFMGMAINSIALTIFMTVGASPTAGPFWKISSILLLFIFVMFFTVGVGTIPRYLTAELFGHSTRSVAVSLSASADWLASLIVCEAFWPLTDVIGNYIFTVFIVLNFFFFFFVNMYVPESAKLSPKSLMKLFDHLE